MKGLFLRRTVQVLLRLRIVFFGLLLALVQATAASAQVTVTPLPPAGGTNPHIVCLTDAGNLTFDTNSNTTCAGAQTNITGLTVTGGGGFTAAGTAGVAVTGTGTVSTNSGNISSTSGNISTSTGNLSAGGTLTVGGNPRSAAIST